MVGGITRLSERMTRILAALYHIDAFTSSCVCAKQRKTEGRGAGEREVG